MIRLSIHSPNLPARLLDVTQPALSLGRAQSNDVVFPADNISGQHAQIILKDGRYLYRDLHSTNGSILLRQGKAFLLKDAQAEVALEVGDRLCLANPDHSVLVEAIDDESEEEDDLYEKTVIAEENAHPGDLEQSLGDDHDALRSAVRLARELTGLETVHEVAELTAQSCLRAFLKARRVLFLVPREDGLAVEFACAQEGESLGQESNMLRSRVLIERCLAERKGFLFLFEQNRMQAVATIISPMDAADGAQFDKDRVVLCCPLFHGERCYGFIEVEAPLGATDRHGLTRRDLSLATLMGHLVSARLHDLENQRARLKLARKATAGFLSATVGHCFKNLLFVPMSISKMLPLCLAQGKLDEVNYMLARNSVNIRYLDMLSHEFANASKDPSEGFEGCYVDRIVEEVAELINQIRPDRIQAEAHLPLKLPRTTCHSAALRRLLMNLTLNAVDACFASNTTEPGRIELKAEFDEAADELTLTVRDNGPGMPESILESLREICRQVQASADALEELQNIAERVRSTKEQGLKEHYGLGFLFVCQTVQQHQGRLTIQSAPDQGATFSLTIPREPTFMRSGAVVPGEDTRE